MNTQHDWFEAEHHAGGIQRIWEPHVHSFFQANLFHVVGRDADLVIDFGMGLRSLSGFLNLTDGKPVIAVATHMHVDHVGSFHEFDCRLGHAAEAAAFSMMEDKDTLADFFRKQPGAVSRLPDPEWTPDRYRIMPATLSEILTEGAQVDLGDRCYRVLHLPGHSQGSIGLLDESNGVFFSGDAIYDGTLVDDLPGCDKTEYRKTMERLRDLDVGIAFGGHGAPMSRERMQSIAASYWELGS